MNDTSLLIGQIGNSPLKVVPSWLRNSLVAKQPIKVSKVIKVVKPSPYDYFFNKHPSEYYNDACIKLGKITTADELYELCGMLLNDYIDYSMLLHKLDSEAKIIKLVREMDKYWHRFYNKIKDRPIIEEKEWLGYANENWYRQTLANEVGVKSEKAPIGFKNMGWGNFYDYLIEDDNKDLIYLSRN